jgi:hypothetical protein
MKYILSAICLVILGFSPVAFSKSFSASKGLQYTISPLFGYETVFRATPTPHTVTHAMYGARLTAGTDIASGELEYTKSSDTENFLTAPEKIVTDSENLKLGLRSTYRFNEFLFASGRLGGQATQTTRTETSLNVPTTIKDDIKYAPYAGLHMGLRMGPISVSLGATAVIRDTSDLSKNDIQHTLSVSLGN